MVSQTMYVANAKKGLGAVGGWILNPKQTTDNETYLPFFVYGTLLPGQPNHYLLEPFVTSVQPATISGCCLYDFGNYPMLVPLANAETAVKGKLCTIQKKPFTSVMTTLDQLEGYDPQNPQSAYQRQQRLVQCADGREVLAWTYLGDMKYVSHVPLIPSGDWAAHVAQQILDLQKWWSNIDTVSGLLHMPPDGE